MGKIDMTIFFAFGLSLAINYAIVLLSKKFDVFIDSPDSNKPQRFHSSPIPRAGGIGIFVSFILFGLYIAPFMWGFYLMCCVLFTSGLWEDLRASLSPTKRLLLQITAITLALVSLGDLNPIITDLGFGVVLPYYLGVIFSIFAIVGSSNAINIIDGFNGLASGIATMVLACIFLVARPDTIVQDWSLLLIIATLGFMVLNFPKGNIFLGDGGAYFLGFMIAILLAILTQNSDVSPWFGISIMIYPIWEVVFSILRRKIQKISPMQADDMHLHTIINKTITKSNPKTSILIWIINLPFMASCVYFAKNNNALLGISVIFVILYLGAYKAIKSRS